MCSPMCLAGVVVDEVDATPHFQMRYIGGSMAFLEFQTFRSCDGAWRDEPTVGFRGVVTCLTCWVRRPYWERS